MGKGMLWGVFFFFAAVAWGDPWMATQEKYSLEYLFENISPPGAAKGAVIASPSTGTHDEPNYFYHWVRDAGLVMGAVEDLAEKQTDSAERRKYDDRMQDYIHFSRSNQTTANPSDSLPTGRLGEPKFEADGRAYLLSWGRPQNDGPALRAITLIRVANRWLAEGREKEVRKLLYDSVMPAETVIKADLEFVAHHWGKSSIDVWEEVSGQHFYVLLTQRRALKEGAILAHRLGDPDAAKFYKAQIPELEKKILSHWNSGLAVIVPTRNRDGGLDYKKSEIDTVVLLAVLHAEGSDGYFGAADDRVLSTLEKQIATFQSLYEVNRKGFGATVLGRYPEDRYNGLTTDKLGNPWFLTTAAVAELHYRAARQIESLPVFSSTSANSAFLKAVGVPLQAQYENADKKELVRKVRIRGDAFLARACFHGLPKGHLSEQIHRDSGYMLGARDLTWSHASYLTAYWHR